MFLSGVAFLVLTLTGFRQRLISALPPQLAAATAAGIGLFLAFIGFRSMGLIAADPATLVTLGDLHAPSTALALAGLLVMAALAALRFPAAILTGIAVTAALGIALGIFPWQPVEAGLASITGTALQLDIGAALRLGLLEIVFVFLFVDLFDNLGTLVAVTNRAGLTRPDGSIPRVERILWVDATATMAGSLAGTSTVVSYIESTAGIQAGGRTGIAAIVTGILFLAAGLLAPWLGAIPGPATAPALVLVGATMLAALRTIDWEDARAAVPAFLTLTTIPLTFSIANGLALGLIAHAALSALSGLAREVSWFAYGLAALLVFRFAYLGG